MTLSGQDVETDVIYTGFLQALLTRMGIIRDGKCIIVTADGTNGPNITRLRNWPPVDFEDKKTGATRTMRKDAELNI